VTTMAGSGDFSPIFESVTSSYKRCSGSETILIGSDIHLPPGAGTRM
jgi:hypothetical protein